jgi:hypothetical protein
MLAAEGVRSAYREDLASLFGASSCAQFEPRGASPTLAARGAEFDVHDGAHALQHRMRWYVMISVIIAWSLPLPSERRRALAGGRTQSGVERLIKCVWGGRLRPRFVLLGPCRVEDVIAYSRAAVQWVLAGHAEVVARCVDNRHAWPVYTKVKAENADLLFEADEPAWTIGLLVRRRHCVRKSRKQGRAISYPKHGAVGIQIDKGS